MSSSRPKPSPTNTPDGQGPWGPPQIPRFPNTGIRRLRNTLSKLSRSSLAEKDLLRKKNQYKIPLTHRNVDTFVEEQLVNEACRPNQRTPEIQVAEWLERVS